MLSPAVIIQKKRDGKPLTREEVHGFIHGMSTGEVTDYQATAFCMATYFQGMSQDETMALTEAMLASGERLDLSSIRGAKVDKHSTGGVGDKVSLILAPLAAACGVKVPMMAGRGLGHSGGTLDKLEAIPGFNVNLTKAAFERALSDVGCAIIGQTAQIAPADKKLYALRDVTATVECIPLIVGSILSKKLAEGTEALVMDVKVGTGAFMKTGDQARKLATALSQVARKMKLPFRALITDMNQPLGYSAGNAIEVQECIEVLRNQTVSNLSSADLKELTVQLCAEMLELTKTVRSLAEGRKLALARLSDGSAWHAFEKMVATQGGDVEFIRNPRKLPRAPTEVTWVAKRRGFVTKMNTEAIGRILVDLGGGRKKATDVIDPGVGMIFHKKLGAKVLPGDPLVTVYAPSPEMMRDKPRFSELEQRFQDAVEITGARKPVPKLIHRRI